MHKQLISILIYMSFATVTSGQTIQSNNISVYDDQANHAFNVEGEIVATFIPQDGKPYGHISVTKDGIEIVYVKVRNETKRSVEGRKENSSVHHFFYYDGAGEYIIDTKRNILNGFNHEGQIIIVGKPISSLYVEADRYCRMKRRYKQ